MVLAWLQFRLVAPHGEHRRWTGPPCFRPWFGRGTVAVVHSAAPPPPVGALPSISIRRGKAWTDSFGAGEDLSWRQRKPLGFTTSFLMGQSLSPRGAPVACRLPRQATSGIDPLATPSHGTEPVSDTDSLNEGRGLNPGDTVVVRVTAKKRMPPRRPRLGSS